MTLFTIAPFTLVGLGFWGYLLCVGLIGSLLWEDSCVRSPEQRARRGAQGRRYCLGTVGSSVLLGTGGYLASAGAAYALHHFVGGTALLAGALVVAQVRHGLYQRGQVPRIAALGLGTALLLLGLAVG